jgi:DNA-binding transcriptional MerR regulator
VASVPGADSPIQLTIEQLAAQSGMTVRNIRSHQARGLLAPPEVRVRVGYYGPDHLAQLRMIRDLQDDGFNLGGIKRLLDDTEGTAERLRRFRGALTHLREEPAETLTVSQLGRRFRVEPADAPSILGRAERLGLLLPVGEGAYEVPSPSLLAVAEEAVRRGIPIDAALDVFETSERHADAVATAFVELFVAQVLRPFVQQSIPAERWQELDEATERLLPLASGALVAVFERRLRERAQEAFAEVARGMENPGDGGVR